MMDQGNHVVLSTRQQKRILLFWSKNFRYNAGDVSFFMKAFDTVDEQNADLYACFLQAPVSFPVKKPICW